MMIPRFSGINNKDMKDVTYEEIVEHFAGEALSRLLTDGGQGLKSAIAAAVGAAASKAEAEQEPVIAESP